MKELFSKKNIGYSFVFMLINITSITVITSLTGLNLRMAFIASGIATLLQKLEYNAFNSNALILSDYGVPFRLIDYYDNKKTG